MEFLSYYQTPLQNIRHPLLDEKRISLVVKREDLNHPQVSGNKWWKLKWNLVKALQSQTKVLTFGGAFSNHIYATAAATKQLGIPSIGVIRGEMILPLNPTLEFASRQSMELHFVSREAYRSHKDQIASSLISTHGECFVIPEGGTNLDAIRGVAEFASSLPEGFDYIVLPVGTGGTMAGIVCGIQGNAHILGVSVLKNGQFLEKEVLRLCQQFASRPPTAKWNILTAYHHGGYAKVTKELLNFIEMFREHSLPLDHVYTGKALYAFFEEVKRDKIKPGSSVLFLHTGGLQGRL